ncbi:MAG: sigma-70 family RNA polymerase sigma factor [bacterium]
MKKVSKIKTPEEIEELIETVMPWIRKLASKIYYERKVSPVISIDDLKSCGVLGAVKAAKSYQEEKSTKFLNYASKFIEGNMRNFVNKQIPPKINGQYPIIISIDQPDIEGNRLEIEDKRLKPPIDGIIKEEDRKILFEALKELPEKNKQIISLWSEGWKEKEIAKEMKINYNTVRTIIVRTRKRLKSILLRKGYEPKL